MGDATEYGLNVRRMGAEPTRAERKGGIQTYLVEDMQEGAADEGTALVDWHTGGDDSVLHCRRCHDIRPASPACKHIVATREHLGFGQ